MMRKKILTFLMCILSCLSLTACSNKDIKLNLESFDLNFRYFLLPTTQSIESVKIDSINLEKDNVTTKDLQQIDGMIFDMYSTCADKTFYNNNFDNDIKFYEENKKYFNDEYYNKIIDDNDFKRSLDNIFEKEDVEFYDTEIISLNQKNKQKYYLAEIICINNELPFLIEYVNFYVDDSNKIIDIELLDDLQQYDNTTKPLNEDSLLNENNIHEDFLNSYSTLISKLTNGALYNKYNLAISNEILMTNEEHELTQEEIDSEKYKEEMNLQVDSLIDTINSNLDNDILKEFFIKGEGTYNNTFVTKYQIKDANGLALSYYTIQTVSKGEITTFVFTFDRIEKEITNIVIED